MSIQIQINGKAEGALGAEPVSKCSHKRHLTTQGKRRPVKGGSPAKPPEDHGEHHLALHGLNLTLREH